MAAYVEPLNPLSIPRGVKLTDELTGDPAKFVCTIGGVTFYYSSLENQELDYNGILYKIAPLMQELDAANRHVGTSVERAMHTKRVRAVQLAIIEHCDSCANENLAAKQFELAIPAALRGLRTLITVYGDGAQDLIPAYLLLAEAHLGLGRIVQAEAFLSTANFILVKHASAPNSLRSRLHRNFGRVHAAQGNNAAALDSFAKDIYFSTLAAGPEHIATSIGYFFLAQVFAAQVRMESALAFFDKVVDIWYKHLLNARSTIAAALNLDFNVTPPEAILFPSHATAPSEDHAQTAAASADAAGQTAAAEVGQPRLTATQISEALEMLEFIRRVRETHLGQTHIATGEVLYTEALVTLEAGKADDAVPLLEAASAIFTEQLGSDHATTTEVTDLVKRLKGHAQPPITIEQTAEQAGESDVTAGNEGETVA